eukprot:393633_1
MSLTSLLSNNTMKCSNKLQLSMPKLCDIAENESFKTISPTASIDDILKATFKAIKPDIKLNPDAIEFIPKSPESSNKSDTHSFHSQPKYEIIEPFTPKHKPRAKYNIYIAKSETRNTLSTLSEHFPTTSTLYYYLDVLTAFQMNDKQMYIFQTIKQPTISFLNLNLHKKDTNELLYATVIPNDKYRIMQANKNNDTGMQNTKWLWQLDEFLTAKEIFYKYDIEPNDLPKSSHKINKFESYLNKNNQEYINSDILYNIDWRNTHIRQIGPVKKSSKIKRNKINIFSSKFIRECKQSWNDFVAIPIIVYENKDDTGFNYRIEWVKIVKINGSYIGISFHKYDNGKWKLQCVYLDKIDIANKHRLFGINPSMYTTVFDQFETSILEIKWL